MLRPKALDHVGILVTDMDRSLRFYQSLGLELLRRRDDEAGASSAVLKVGDQELNMFCVPDLAAAGTDEPHRLDHFCLEMQSASMDDLMAGLRAAGIEIAKGPIARRDGMALFLHDPDGVRVELQIKHSS